MDCYMCLCPSYFCYNSNPMSLIVQKKANNKPVYYIKIVSGYLCSVTETDCLGLCSLRDLYKSSYALKRISLGTFCVLLFFVTLLPSKKANGQDRVKV